MTSTSKSNERITDASNNTEEEQQMRNDGDVVSHGMVMVAASEKVRSMRSPSIRIAGEDCVSVVPSDVLEARIGDPILDIHALSNNTLTNNTVHHHHAAAAAPRSMSSSFRMISGHSSLQGRRRTMEDQVTMLQHPLWANWLRKPQEYPPISYFGLYDGHGGAACSSYCNRMLHNNVSSNAAFPNSPARALQGGIEKTDADFISAMRQQGVVASSGSTAIVVLFVRDEITVANVGDSRAILCRKGKVENLSYDHKPNRKDEKQRIVELGGFVGRTEREARIRQDRVYPGGLALTRSLGDIELKASGLIISTPEIVTQKITKDDSFVVIACDGVWDVLSSNAVVKEVIKFEVAHGQLATKCSEYIAQLAYDLGSTDNISVIVIFFSHDIEPS